MKFPAELNHLINTALRLFISSTEAIRTAPYAETRAGFSRDAGRQCQAVRKLFAETRRVRAAVETFSVDCSGVKCVNVQLHTESFPQKCKKIQVCKRHRFGCTFIGVIDPREVFRT